MVSGSECARRMRRERYEKGIITPRTEEQREHANKKCLDRYYQIQSEINPCYLKEARAILQGKDVRGRNKCTKLAGD